MKLIFIIHGDAYRLNRVSAGDMVWIQMNSETAGIEKFCLRFGGRLERLEDYIMSHNPIAILERD
jgi:hypothetical protein